MTKTVSLRQGALIVALCGVFAACSSQDAANPDTAEGTQSDAKNTATSQTLAYGAVSAGGDLVQDPHGSLFNESDWVRFRAIYDTLLVTDTSGALVDGLAASMEPNDDASVWTLTLKDGITFSDGTALTADDVMYTLKRMDEKKAENGMRLATIDVAGSKATDKKTLELATTTPDAELPRAISGMIQVVKKDTTDFAKPIGAGPFTVDSTSSNATTLKRRDDYWADAPDLAEVTIYGFADPSALTTALTSGKVDIAASLPSVSAATLKDSSEVTLEKRKGAFAAPLLLRVDKGPFAKESVREAVKIALDREAMVKTVLNGHGTVGRDMIKLTDPSVPKDAPEVKQDTERAKELLAEAGSSSLDVTLHTTSAYPSMQAGAAVVKEQLKDVGINVTIKEHPPATYWSEAYTVEPFTMGYWADVPFATTVRQTTLTTSAFSETGWKKPEFDKDFAAAMATTDDADRNAKLGKLHQQMAKEGGWVVWGFGDGITAVRKGVKGLDVSNDSYDLSDVSVDG